MKPWKLLEDDQIFVVVDRVSGENLYCSVLGVAGYEFGLAVYIGQEGLQSLKNTQENIMEMFELIVRQRSMLLSFKGQRQWVQIRSLVPGMHPWSIDEEEARMLLLAIEQTIAMCQRVKEGVIVPVMGVKDVFPARVPVGQEWADDIIRVEDERVPVADSPLLVSELDLASAKKIGRQNASVEFDLFYVEFTVQENKENRPHLTEKMECPRIRIYLTVQI